MELNDLIIDVLEKKGAKHYEVYLQESKINELHIEKNSISFSNKVLDSGYSVRVLTKGLGFSSSNVKSPRAIRETVTNAIKTSRVTKKIKFQFPSQEPFRKVKIVDKKIRKDAEQALREYADLLLNLVDHNTFISFGKLRTYDTRVRILNSRGMDIEREETFFMLELSIVVEKNGEKMEFWPHEYRRRIEDLPLSNVEEWVKIAEDQLRAGLPKTERMTVIFSPSCVLDGLGSVLGFHATGAAKVNGVTKLSLGEKVASQSLTIISDGLYPFGLMTSSFDDEGVPQRRIPLIESGFFKNFVYDQFYGIKDGFTSTGNGLRQSEVFYVFDTKFASMPSNQVSNFYVKPGDYSMDELVGINRGILIERFSWLSPDPTTGKFSSEIRAGYYIEKGELAKPIKGGLVSGDFFELMKNITGISDESSITSGGTVLAGICPYMRFENVQVVGK